MSGLLNKLIRLFPSYRMGNTIRRENEFALKEIRTSLNQMDYKMEYLFWLSQQQERESMAETKKRVFHNMPKAQGESRLIQNMNHQILKYLKKACDANGLRFYLVFGTLMGAVRNQGFIPWDDDLDIAMMRADAEQLIQILRDDPIIHAEHCYSNMYEKFIKVKFRDSDIFFVDIFFMDEFQADKSNLVTRYSELLEAHRDYVAEMKQYFAETGENILEYRIPKPNPKLDARMEAKYTQLAKKLQYYGNGNYISFAIDDSCLMTNTWYAYPKEEILNSVSVIFEGETYKTFSNYDVFLRNTYGDYWRLPKNLTGGHAELTNLTADDFYAMAQHGVLTVKEAKHWIANSRKYDGEIFSF